MPEEITGGLTGNTKAGTLVLKIGGNQLDDPEFVAGFARTTKTLCGQGQVPVIVHGGGKAIRTLQNKFGTQPRYIDGLRVTDDEAMLLVRMALCGQANTSLVAALTNEGVEAQGFNGADRGLLRSRPHPNPELGRVGQIAAVRAEVIRASLAAGVVPVIAPVALAEDEGFHNVNADQAAGAVAAALGADRVIFLTDVPGVLRDEQPIPSLCETEARSMIASGIASGGMAVKLNAALDALSAGVAGAIITNLAGLANGTGTSVLR